MSSLIKKKPMTTLPTLEQFNAYVQELARHDWYYDYSDDHSVWRRGENNYQALRKQASSDPLYQQAFNIWAGYIYRGTNLKEAEARILRDAAIDTLRQSLA